MPLLSRAAAARMGASHPINAALYSVRGAAAKAVQDSAGGVPMIPAPYQPNPGLPGYQPNPGLMIPDPSAILDAPSGPMPTTPPTPYVPLPPPAPPKATGGLDPLPDPISPFQQGINQRLPQVQAQVTVGDQQDQKPGMTDTQKKGLLFLGVAAALGVAYFATKD